MASQQPSCDFHDAIEFAHINAEITRHSSVAAYVDSFWFLFAISLAAIPLLVFMRGPRRDETDSVQVHMD